MDLLHPIAYLERSDFSNNGELLGVLKDLPVFILIHTGKCSACANAKPDFQALADLGFLNCHTIQLDGERQSEIDIAKIIDKIYPNFKTVPSYILYLKGDKRIPYDGGRSVEEMKQFVLQYI